MKFHLKSTFAAACLTLLALAGAQANTVQVQVGMNGLKFTPATVNVNVGDTVQWVWDASGHSSTSGTPSHPDGMWDSGILNTGATFSFTFSTAGAFAYYCTPHGACCGMVGTVNVANATDTVTITNAKYSSTAGNVTIAATDSNSTATLTATITSSGVVLGTLTNKGGGSYSGKFPVASNPKNVTVTSSLGGSATAKVRGH